MQRTEFKGAKSVDLIEALWGKPNVLLIICLSFEKPFDPQGIRRGLTLFVRRDWESLRWGYPKRRIKAQGLLDRIDLGISWMFCLIILKKMVPWSLIIKISVSCSWDPAYWDDPASFKPDRFLNSDTDFRGKDFKYIPFGAGRRICPGSSLAMRMVSLMLANLVHNFDWELPNGLKPEDLDMNDGLGMTLHKHEPLVVIPIDQVA
ncbi:Iridoid oxidase [Sesamum angolense]|uniref:Iridoid oxidase n=1 Tax=Sesamum angolense TaxID=2727404 RepID=A0AAE2BWR9_9LAMI|nr:Iridoid oxidase [Sesamum angolense]